MAFVHCCLSRVAVYHEVMDDVARYNAFVDIA